MPRNTVGQVEEAAKITKSVEILFRRLIQFLVGRISLVKIQEMVKFIFIEEVENKLRIENPGKNVPLTQIALLSGLDTRTLTKIRNSNHFRKPFHQETSFLKNSTLGASILDYWSSKPPYVDEQTGTPKALDVSGTNASFESLFSECSTGRGITYRSMLERLEKSGSVALKKNGQRVHLKRRTYLPSESKDQIGAIQMGFSALINLSDTVFKNIDSIDNGGKALYQRGAWTYRLNPENASKLHSELRVLLEDTDREARIIIAKYEENFSRSGQITAGVSSFYFEESESK